MTKHRLRKAKEHPSVDNYSLKPEPRQPDIILLHPGTPAEIEKEHILPFLAWPSHLFEMMMAPWHGFTSVSSWMDSWRIGGESVMPESGYSETETEYFYRVKLPGITREQIALNYRNGAIMLRVQETEDRRGKGHHRYMRSHSIRRAFSLPGYTDTAKITAEMKDGVLTITIPKTDKPGASQSRIIDVS